MTCRWCRIDFMPAPMARGQVFCSRRCLEQDRNQRPRACACGWVFVARSRRTKLCAWCRAGASGPLRTIKRGPACSLTYSTCRECGALGVARVSRNVCRQCAPNGWYVPVAPRPITCKQCSVTFIGKWRSICEACAESNGRVGRRSRKAALRGRSYIAADIYQRDGWRCHLCRRVVPQDKQVPHPSAPTIDHLVPISAGGLDDPMNVALAHFICNSKRGARGIVQLRLVA
jgi:hypothetical protein